MLKVVVTACRVYSLWYNLLWFEQAGHVDPDKQPPLTVEDLIEVGMSVLWWVL